jgi:hypothetical protein
MFFEKVFFFTENSKGNTCCERALLKQTTNQESIYKGLRLNQKTKQITNYLYS